MQVLYGMSFIGIDYGNMHLKCIDQIEIKEWEIESTEPMFPLNLFIYLFLMNWIMFCRCPLFFRLDSYAFITTIDMNGDKINNYGARIGNRLSINTQKSNHSQWFAFLVIAKLTNRVALSMECLDRERFMIKIQS